MAPKIIAIGAGKGGVGKTFISTNLAISFSKLGLSVLIIDFDLSGANIHTTLGCELNEKNLFSYFSRSESLINLVQPTAVPRLSYIQGIWNNWETFDINQSETKRFITDTKDLGFDYVIIDLGPGATSYNLEIFKNADEKILISSAEPTSIEKTYRYIESYMVSQIQSFGNKDANEKLCEELRKYRAQNKTKLFSFRKYLQDAVGFDFNHFDQLNEKPVRLILNGTRSNLDQQLGYSIKSVCNKYFDLSIDYSGYIDFENAVWQSVKNREPFLITMPFTPLSGQFLSICKNIISDNENAAKQFRAVV